MARHARKLEDGRVWAEHARALLRGPTTHGAQSSIDRKLGHLETLVGDGDEGITLLERGLKLAKADTDEGSAATADAAVLLADAYRARGRVEDALELGLLVLRSNIERLGPSHPLVGQAHSELGGTYAMQQRFADAQRELEAGISIEESVGETLALATMLSKLGYVFGRLDEHERARGQYERALAIGSRPLDRTTRSSSRLG